MGMEVPLLYCDRHGVVAMLLRRRCELKGQGGREMEREGDEGRGIGQYSSSLESLF
jgi:hypothetical protein